MSSVSQQVPDTAAGSHCPRFYWQGESSVITQETADWQLSYSSWSISQKSLRLYGRSSCFSEVSTRWCSHWQWGWLPATKLVVSRSLLWGSWASGSVLLWRKMHESRCCCCELVLGVKIAFPKRENVTLQLRSEVSVKSTHLGGLLWPGRKAG